MTRSMTAPTAIGFDADDTLWHNERVFKMTEARFASLLADHAEPVAIGHRLIEAERRNLAIYGYGVKGFTLSMIETAIELTDGRVPAATIEEIMAFGRAMLRHPVETLPHVREALERLSGSHRLILITKGDLFDQERKLAQSGLGDFFHAVEIVSEKTSVTYERIFARHANGPERAMMVGNSLKSDIVPAIVAGSWGVHVPHAYNWALEHHDEPTDSARYRRIAHLGELADLIAGIE